MPYEVYKILHLFGLAMVLISLAAIWGVNATGTTPTRPVKAAMGAGHGVGLLIMLVSAFGMLAKLGMMSPLPGWSYGKLALWLILGGFVTVVKKPFGRGLWVPLALCVFVGVAAWLAILKPF